MRCASGRREFNLSDRLSGRRVRASRLLGAAKRVAAAALLAAGAAIAPALAEEARSAEEAPAPVTIIAFGDSLIQGYGLPAAQGFAPQLQRWLESQGAGPVTVVNSGVSGETTAGGLARLDWAVGPDADAVILQLGGNDALRGNNPPLIETVANLDEMLRILTKDKKLPVLLAGMRAPGNWGSAYKETFDGMYPRLAQKHGARLYPFFLAGLADGLDGASLDQSLFLPNDFHPSAKGVARIVEGIGPQVLALVVEARARKAAPRS
ncbi:MAG: arylesterase [Pseudomonadota bacterium]